MNNFQQLSNIKDIVEPIFHFLVEIEGYSLTLIQFANLENSHKLRFLDQPFVRLTYHNTSINRRIQIDINIASIPSLFFENTLINDYFIHTDYFSFVYGKVIQIEDFKGETKLEKLKDFCLTIKTEITGRLHKVISGEEWIDVPEDLGPEK